MKRLIPIVLLLMLPMSSWAASGSVMHHVTDSALGSAGSWLGIGHQGSRVAVTTDGDVYTLIRNYTGGQGVWLNYWLSFGAGDSLQIGGTNGIFGLTGGEVQTTMYQFYDSIYAVSASAATGSTFELRRAVNGTVTGSVVTDASASTTTNGDRPGIVHVGNNLLTMHITDDSLAFNGDSSRAYLSNGAWDGTTTWTQRGVNSATTAGVTTFGTGLRLPMDSSTNVGGSIAIIDMNAEDLYVCDTNGFTTILEAAITSTDRQTPGFYRFWAVKNGVRDSILFLWQADATTNSALLGRPGHFTYGATGSATGWVWDTANEITILADGQLPDAYAPCLTATWFPGTDSGMLFFRKPDNDSVDIIGKLITRSGRTYGADTTIYNGAVANRKAFGLQASPTAYVSGNLKQFALVMQDSLVATADSARVLLVTYDTGDPTPVVQDTTSTIYVNSISGHQPVNSKTGPAYVNKK